MNENIYNFLVIHLKDVLPQMFNLTDDPEELKIWFDGSIYNQLLKGFFYLIY
jgi:hypothetical protein